MTAWVVNRVPRPMMTPANAKSITGVNIAPPNLWIFCIIWNSPPDDGGVAAVPRQKA